MSIRRSKRREQMHERDAKKLEPLVREFCAGTGKELPGCGAFLYEHALETRAGKLHVSVSSLDPTIFCCFDDPKRATDIGLVCNPYSGKWNFHGEDSVSIFAEWKEAVERIMGQ